MELSLKIEMDSTVCSGTEGAYQDYLRYYFAAMSPQQLEERTVMMDDVPKTPEDIIAAADRHLTDNYPAALPLKGVLPAAACIVRLCMNHEYPQAEVRSRVVTKLIGQPICTASHSPGQSDMFDGRPRMMRIRKYYVKPSTLDANQTMNSMQLRPGRLNPPSGDPHEVKGTVFYLPRPGIPSTLRSHPVVLADRGAASQPVLFGLLGDETVYELPRLQEQRFLIMSPLYI